MSKQTDTAPRQDLNTTYSPSSLLFQDPTSHSVGILCYQHIPKSVRQKGNIFNICTSVIHGGNSLCYKAVVLNLFGTRDQFHGKFFSWTKSRREWFWDASSILHLLCTLFLLLLCQLHLRSSGITSWRLGTPAVKEAWMEKLERKQWDIQEEYPRDLTLATIRRKGKVLKTNVLHLYHQRYRSECE